MKFLKRRKQKKLLAELKSRRHAEDDLLSPALKAEFDNIISQLESAPETELDQAIDSAAKAYGKMPYPARRGTMFALLDLILVVGAVAFGLRGLFFQPFRIPTSSMQPTLYGIHYIAAENSSNPYLKKFPSFLNAVLFAAKKVHAVAGELPSIYASGDERHIPGAVFDHTAVNIGGRELLLPGNPAQVISYAKLIPEREFAANEVIADGFVTLGDHLFVERFSLYLSPPKRGDVMVFTTDGLFTDDGTPLDRISGIYYIKRLVALPGDTVKISGNQLYIKRPQDTEFKRIQDVEPKFKKLYSGKGGYHGHLENMGSWEFAYGREYTVPEDRYIMLGDNSKFSMDSRFFGPVHRNKLVGRAWLTFYPFSRRTGLIDRVEPLDIPTGNSFGASFDSMYQQ